MDVLSENERYYSDSHWFSWIGPKLAESTPDAARINAEVERVFQEANKIQECVDRHRRALTAKPAAWHFSEEQPEEATQTLERVLGWMVPRSARLRYAQHGGRPICFPHAIAEAVHYRLLGGEGYLRLWLPKRFENAPNWQRVALHAPHPNNVLVERDEDDFPFRITYSFKGAEGETLKEVQELDDSGRTNFRVENTSGEVVPGSESSLDLGGRFTIALIQGTPIVTKAVKRCQNGINYTLTLMLRNLQYGGFLRDIIINGMPPGEYDEQGKFIPDPGGWVEGPGAKLEISGIPIYDSEGNVSNYTTPSVDTRNPVDVNSFLEAYKASAAIAYEAFGQGHILASDMTISGVSRQQMRQDFSTSVAEDASALRVALSDTYAAAYLLATEGSDPDRELGIIVEPKLSVSDLTPEESSQLVEIHSARLRSTRSTMGLLGVENPDAEMEAIAAETEERMKTAQLNRDAFLGDDEEDEDDDDDDDNNNQDEDEDEDEDEDV